MEEREREREREKIQAQRVTKGESIENRDLNEWRKFSYFAQSWIKCLLDLELGIVKVVEGKSKEWGRTFLFFVDDWVVGGRK